MKDIIDYKIVCSECKHENIFKVEGETIVSITGHKITYPTEPIGERICEGCGRELN